MIKKRMGVYTIDRRRTKRKEMGMLSLQNGADSIGWLSGYNYRKKITVSRPSGSITNYQMKLLVTESSSGPTNLLSNGDFASSTTGWTAGNCTLASVSGGQSGNCCRLTRTTGTQQYGRQIISLIIGNTYRLYGYVKSGTSGSDSFGLYATDVGWTWSGSVTGTTSNDWVYYSADFIAKSTSVYVYFYKLTGTTGTMLFDEIGIKEIQNTDCNGHCLSTFNDLRFTTSNGVTLLDYWIESINGTSPNKLATMWIEFDSIGINDTTFYMYYGKADAIEYSNGSNTFSFFDDVERGINGDAIGGNWTVSRGSIIVSTTRDISDVTGFTGTRSMQMTGNTSNYPSLGIRNICPTGNNIAYYWKMYLSTNTMWVSTIESTLSEKYIQVYYNWTAFGYYTTPSVHTAVKSNLSGRWYHVKLYNIDWIAGTYTIDVEGTIAAATMISTGAGTSNTWWCSGVNITGHYVWMDNMIAHKYYSTAPTFGLFGVEEIGS